jgi:hypothetical protein
VVIHFEEIDMVEKSKDGESDLLGRTFSNICGWLPGRTDIPVGSKVRINAGQPCSYNRCYAGNEAVVVENFIEGRGVWETPKVRLRFVKPENEREPVMNYMVSKREDVEVLTLGDGTILPVADYALTRKELLDAAFAEVDSRFEGYSNMPTFIAALYLRQSQKHQQEVFRMVRRNGSINEERLREYFYKKVEHSRMTDVAWWPDGFPEWDDYKFRVNWKEISDEFSVFFKEQSEYEQRKAA